MPKPNSIRLVKPRANDALSDEQIRELTLQVCAYGDDAEEHAKALMVLADEILKRSTRAEDIAYVIRKTAFSRLSDDLVDAQVKLLRGEML